MNDTVKALKDLHDFIRQDEVRCLRSIWSNELLCCQGRAFAAVALLADWPLRPGSMKGALQRRPAAVRGCLLTARPACHPRRRSLQPPLADAESIRDAVIAKLFEDLSKQGLDANHPFGAYGGSEAAEPSTSAAPMERQPSRLRSLLSLGGKRSRKVRGRPLLAWAMGQEGGGGGGWGRWQWAAIE